MVEFGESCGAAVAGGAGIAGTCESSNCSNWSDFADAVTTEIGQIQIARGIEDQPLRIVDRGKQARPAVTGRVTDAIADRWDYQQAGRRLHRNNAEGLDGGSPA